MANTTLIRPGTPADFEAIDRFDPFGGDRQGELAGLIGRCCFVATRDGQVVGYITGVPGGFLGKPFIAFLAVDAACRRQGIATRLIDHTVRELGAGRVFISTEDMNDAMLALLTAAGWTEAGRVRGANDDGSAEVFFYRDHG